MKGADHRSPISRHGRVSSPWDEMGRKIKGKEPTASCGQDTKSEDLTSLSPGDESCQEEKIRPHSIFGCAAVGGVVSLE